MKRGGKKICLLFLLLSLGNSCLPISQAISRWYTIGGPLITWIFGPRIFIITYISFGKLDINEKGRKKICLLFLLLSLGNSCLPISQAISRWYTIGGPLIIWVLGPKNIWHNFPSFLFLLTLRSRSSFGKLVVYEKGAEKTICLLFLLSSLRNSYIKMIHN